MIYADTAKLAVLTYTLSSLRVQKPGEYVVCAVTGQRIPLANLRYWSEARQEAYVDAVAATRRQEEAIR
jgi:hypothetical protein